MGKINDKNWISLLKSVLFLVAIGFGVFAIVYVILHILVEDSSDADDLFIAWDIGVLLIITSCFLINCYTLPKCEDGLYKRKDGRVYQGDWSKFFGANGKGKLTWADGSYYEGEFKKGNLCGKGKKVLPNGESYEGEWKNSKANGKGKLTWSDGSCYEGEFKNGKPHGMGIIKMKNGYYYKGEFGNGKRTGRFKKQVLTTGGVIEGEFRDNGSGGFDGIGKVSTSNGFVFEGTFKNGELSGEGKTITPNGEVLIGVFDKGKLKTGKQILKNGEYSEGNWINGRLIGMAMYYFKDGSYYEGECGDMGWQGIGTYVTKKGDKYPTEFPYDIINVFMYGLNAKIKEIHGDLKYVPKSEKEKTDEKNMYLEILKSGTDIQKEIAKLSFEEDEKSDILLDSLKIDNSVGNFLKIYTSIFKLSKRNRGKNSNIANKYAIELSKKMALSYSYGQFFFRLDGAYGKAIDSEEISIKIFQFLNPKNILDFIVKREEKNKERVILIDEFSDKYRVYVQSYLDWREYEKNFWEHNFKPDK